MKAPKKPDTMPPLIRVALKKKQFQMAMNGNVPMLIHLGKQYLGQTENGAKVDRDDYQKPIGPCRQ